LWIKIPSLEIEAEVETVKEKDQESGFHTYPIFDDKRYWARTFTQMNMKANGYVKVASTKIVIDTSDKRANWGINYNDWSGILPHKTFLTQSW